MHLAIRSPSAALLLALCLSCGSAAPPPAVAAAKPQTAPKPAPIVRVSLASVGLDGSALDRSIDPCTDFYGFACGGWIRRTRIPADRSRWMRSFNVIHDANEAELRRILERARAAKEGDAATQKLGRFYGACMDEAAVEKAGLAPIRPLLDRIAGARARPAIVAAITELHRHRIWAVFDISNDQDFKDATKMIAVLDQNGLGLPDRDYYATGDQPIDEKKPEERTKEERAQLAKSEEIRAAYVEHVARMLGLAGLSSRRARKAAQDVLRLETALAKVSKTKVARRDPHGMYNKIDRVGVEKVTPLFDWAAYLRSLGYPDITDINVTAPKFFDGFNRLLRDETPAAWRSYLTWHVLRAAAPSLTKAFVDESFALKRKLTGQKELRPRWKRCIEATDAALGELLAQPFVRAKFAGDSKKAAERMVHEIGAAFSREIDGYDWMDAKTRARAKAKLDAMAYLIGYPDKWKAYDFTVDPKRHASNVLASNAYELRRDLGKVGKPVDRSEWLMSPPTVNAYYHPLKNHMVFPAGILQPPFYSVDASVPVNLGGMGMVVGHELTHGFDDEGSKFDQDGNLKEWWDPGVRARFEQRTACVADQYAAYEALPGVKLNGKLTLGENIADLGGIKLAFRAFRAMRSGAAEVTVADGFTEEQQFFLGTAQVWCGKYREEAARLHARTDPHSPPRWRVNGPLSNLKGFAEAFSCAEGSPMVRPDRCQVW